MCVCGSGGKCGNDANKNLGYFLRLFLLHFLRSIVCVCALNSVSVASPQLPMNQENRADIKLVPSDIGWLNDGNKMNFWSDRFNLALWVTWTCCIWHRPWPTSTICCHEDLRCFGIVGLVKSEEQSTVHRIRPHRLHRSFEMEMRMMWASFNAPSALLQTLSPRMISSPFKGWNWPRHKPTLVLSTMTCNRIHCRWRSQSPVAHYTSCIERTFTVEWKERTTAGIAATIW